MHEETTQLYKKPINGKRFLAFILDITIVTTIALFLHSIVGLFKPLDEPTTLLITIPTFLIAFSYLIFSQNTIGKHVFGIRVYDLKSNGQPKIYQRLIRYLFLMLWPIEAIILLANKNNRRFGDMLASTIVYPVESERKWYIRLILAVSIFVGCFYLNLIAMSFASQYTGIYKTTKRYITETKIGEEQFGKPIIFDNIPRNIQVLNNEGIVVLPAEWEEKKGYIVVKLNRTDDNWNVIDISLTEEAVSKGFSYKFQY